MSVADLVSGTPYAYGDAFWSDFLGLCTQADAAQAGASAAGSSATATAAAAGAGAAAGVTSAASATTTGTGGAASTAAPSLAAAAAAAAVPVQCSQQAPQQEALRALTAEDCATLRASNPSTGNFRVQLLLVSNALRDWPAVLAAAPGAVALARALQLTSSVLHAWQAALTAEELEAQLEGSCRAAPAAASTAVAPDASSGGSRSSGGGGATAAAAAAAAAGAEQELDCLTDYFLSSVLWFLHACPVAEAGVAHDAALQCLLTCLTATLYAPLDEAADAAVAAMAGEPGAAATDEAAADEAVARRADAEKARLLYLPRHTLRLLEAGLDAAAAGADNGVGSGGKGWRRAQWRDSLVREELSSAALVQVLLHGSSLNCRTALRVAQQAQAGGWLSLAAWRQWGSARALAPLTGTAQGQEQQGQEQQGRAAPLDAQAQLQRCLLQRCLLLSLWALPLRARSAVAAALAGMPGSDAVLQRAFAALAQPAADAEALLALVRAEQRAAMRQSWQETSTALLYMCLVQLPRFRSVALASSDLDQLLLPLLAVLVEAYDSQPQALLAARVKAKAAEAAEAAATATVTTATAGSTALPAPQQQHHHQQPQPQQQQQQKAPKVARSWLRLPRFSLTTGGSSSRTAAAAAAGPTAVADTAAATAAAHRRLRGSGRVRAQCNVALAALMLLSEDSVFCLAAQQQSVPVPRRWHLAQRLQPTCTLASLLAAVLLRVCSVELVAFSTAARRPAAAAAAAAAAGAGAGKEAGTEAEAEAEEAEAEAQEDMVATALAVLANVMSEPEGVHAWVAERLVRLAVKLSLREPRSSAQNWQWSRASMEVAHACLVLRPAANAGAMYALLQTYELLETFRGDERLWDLVQNMLAVSEALRQRVDEEFAVQSGGGGAGTLLPAATAAAADEAGQTTASWSSAEEAMRMIGRLSRTLSPAGLRDIPAAHYAYREDPDPANFFAPWLWAVVLDTVALPWDLNRVLLFEFPYGAD